MARRVEISDVRDLATERGGKLLTTDYENNHQKLLFRCKNNHEFETTYQIVKRGSWCPTCSGVKRHTIRDLQQFAESKNGKCLSDHYTNSLTKVEWECEHGHRWSASYNNIQSGSWCPECSYEKKRTGFRK